MSAPQPILKSSVVPVLRGRADEQQRRSKQQSTSAIPSPSTTAPNSSPAAPHSLDAFFDRLIRFFSSLRLTVVCLGLSIILVFAGTLAQVEIGLLQAQNEFFRSFFIYWTPKGASFKIPVFPGGYFLGGLLLINLLTAHITRFKWSKKKAGIWIIHSGLILLLVGQLLTDMLARESALQLAEGEAKNFSEDFRDTELVFIDKSDPQSDMVYSIPERLFAHKSEIR